MATIISRGRLFLVVLLGKIQHYKICIGKHRQIFILIIISVTSIFYALIQRHKRKIKCRNTTEQLRIQSDRRHRILCGTSGNLLVYQQGVMKAIFEHYGVDKFRNMCTFEGLSGGAAASGYSLASVYGCGDLDFWYAHNSTLPTKAAMNRALGIFLTRSNAIYAGGYHYYNFIMEWNNDVKPKWLCNNQLVIWLTCANVFKSEFLCNVDHTGAIESADRMGSIIAGSCYIPFACNIRPWFYYNIGAMKCMDGGLAQLLGDQTIFRAKNCKGEDCKVLYINCDRLCKEKLANGKKSKKTLSNGNVIHYLNICEWDDFNFKDRVPRCMTETDQLYQKGYNLAKQNMESINVILKDFFEGFNE
eukprot:263031_1